MRDGPDAYIEQCLCTRLKRTFADENGSAKRTFPARLGIFKPRLPHSLAIACMAGILTIANLHIRCPNVVISWRA